MQRVDLNQLDNENQNPRKKKKVRGFRIWEMTSDPKSFLVFMILALFFVATSYFCLSDVVRQRNETRMEISRLRHDNGTAEKAPQRKKKANAKEERKKRKIFNISLRQAIKKEKNL